MSDKLKFVGQRSIKRIGHHLAAARPSYPTADDGGEFPCRAACDNDLNLFRSGKFAVASCVLSVELFIQLYVLRALAAIIAGNGAERYAGVIEKKRAYVLFAETVELERPYWLG